jgi:DNA-binding response OmpR family regulator
METETAAHKKIFLVEDDHYLSRVYERAFKFAGYDVESVFDGAEASKRLAALDPMPAAVVLDILLPSLNGYDLLREIRRNTRFDQVPVIMLTNSFINKDGDAYIAAGADAFLIKIENQSKDVVKKITDLINNGRAKPDGS